MNGVLGGGGVGAGVAPAGGTGGLQPPVGEAVAPPSGKNDDFVGEHWGKKKKL